MRRVVELLFVRRRDPGLASPSISLLESTTGGGDSAEGVPTMRVSRLLLAATLIGAPLPAAAARLPFGFGGESYSVPTWVRSFAIGDFDQDGRDDVLAVLENGSVLQWHAAQDGTLETVAPPALGASARSIAVLHANADGHLDIAVGLASTPPAVV